MSAQETENINYCLRCGAALKPREHYGHTRPTCPNCNWIYFADPKVAVAVLIKNEGEVMLVRRAVNPFKGRWSLPAGFVDAGEDPKEAAQRECLEETGMKVLVTGLLDVIHGQEHTRGSHILIAYRAEIISGKLQPGDDVDRVEFFNQNKLPPLAFSSTEEIIRR